MWTRVLILLAGCHITRTQKSEPWLAPDDAGLFRGSDRAHFAIVIQASEVECFWHFTHQSRDFYMSHMVQWVTGLASDHRLFVTVVSPDGVLMGSSNQAVAELHFHTEVTGFYQICLGNHNNQFGAVRVFLDFGVVYDGLGDEEEDTVLNSTLSRIQESTVKLQTSIFHMWRYYSSARMRRGADHYLLLSNLSYVTWWSVTQSLFIVLSGCLQLLFLRRLFISSSHRTRC